MIDAVIVSACRTPAGKAPNGALKGARPDDLAAIAIGEALKRAPGVLPADVDDGPRGRGRVLLLLVRHEGVRGAEIDSLGDELGKAGAGAYRLEGPGHPARVDRHSSAFPRVEAEPQRRPRYRIARGGPGESRWPERHRAHRPIKTPVAPTDSAPRPR